MIDVGQSLSESHLATPQVVGLLRGSVADYAKAVGFSGTQLDDIRLAVSEAVTNVVVHAYRDSPGPVHLTVTALDKEFWILVADDGCGHNTPPSHAGLGWGLALITRVSDEFTLAERSHGGTEARMCFSIPAAPHDATTLGQ